MFCISAIIIILEKHADEANMSLVNEFKMNFHLMRVQWHDLFHDLTKTIKDYRRLSKTIEDYRRLWKNTKDYRRLCKNIEDYVRISKTM